MKNYFIYNNLGKILRTGSAPEEYVAIQAKENEFVLEGVADDTSQYINGSVIIDMPPKLTKHHVFDFVTKAWQDPRTPADIKTSQWQKIKVLRDARKSGGFKVGVKWFHSDEPSRAQYSILLTTVLEKSLPVSYVLNAAWKDMSGAKEPLTVATLRQIRDAGLLLEATLFAVAENHRASMEAAPNPETYDFTTGWPAIYGEAI